jgi:hypothetical protein
MSESSLAFAKLESAIVDAGGLLSGLPERDVKNTLHELKLKSYVLLCHAAIEEYLERISIAVLKESLSAARSDGKIRDSLLCVCSYYKLNVSKVVESRNHGDAFLIIFLNLCKKAISEHELALSGVHGVKTKDQEAVFFPIGVNLCAFDRILSQNLNSFGVKRGGLAHSFGMRQITPKNGVESEVWNLFRLLLNFDNMLCDRFKISLHIEAQQI